MPFLDLFTAKKIWHFCQDATLLVEIALIIKSLVEIPKVNAKRI